MDDLEAAVRASWGREAIAVYGDHLQAQGDPRGELVAIDLHIDEIGATPELVARRGELIAGWFGRDLPPGSVRYGFVDVDATGAQPDEQLAVALDGPGARWVRSLKVVGPPELLRRAIDRLVATERPWLTRVVMRQWNEAPRPTLDASACDQLVAATPNLRELEIHGRRVLGAFAHPAVRHMRVSGFDAVATLARRPGALPALELLDWAMHDQLAREFAPPDRDALAALLPSAGLPALRTLDLSRNHAGHSEPDMLGGGLEVLAFLHARDVRRQLEVVHVPAPRTEGEQTSLQAALAEMDALRELFVHGEPRCAPAHPTASIRHVARPSSA